jgi:xanthine dehydrogenase accessory factor
VSVDGDSQKIFVASIRYDDTFVKEDGAWLFAELKLSAPVRLDLGASSPEETALSILAEVVAARHGHAGGRLATRAGRIHVAA